MPGEGAEAVLLWPVVTPLGFLLLAALIIALGASSTAKYEFERNQVQAQRRQAAVAAGNAGAAGAPAAPVAAGNGAGAGEAVVEAVVESVVEARAEAVVESRVEGSAAQAGAAEQATAVGVAGHPAGRHRVDPAAEPAWWLVDEDGEGGQVVAGPFADRMDADWSALTSGLCGAVEVVHGVQRADGGLVRRQSPQEKAWLRELGGQLDRLPEDWDQLLTEDDALTTLVVEVAAALVEAGLPVHDCVGSGSAGGVCLTPGPAYGGVLVNWHQHERMAGDVSRAPAATAVQATMTAAVAGLLSDLGFEHEPFGSEGCLLVTDLVGGR